VGGIAQFNLAYPTCNKANLGASLWNIHKKSYSDQIYAQNKICTYKNSITRNFACFWSNLSS